MMPARTDLPRYVAADQLPPDTAPPTAIDIVWAAAASWCVWHKAVLGQSDELTEIAADLRLERYFTSDESAFLADDGEIVPSNCSQTPVSQFVEPLGCLERCEKIWTLLWSIGIVEELSVVDTRQSTAATLALFAGRSAEDIVYEARRKSTADIARALDSLRMARQLQCSDVSVQVLQSRIDALEWVQGTKEPE